MKRLVALALLLAFVAVPSVILAQDASPTPTATSVAIPTVEAGSAPGSTNPATPIVVNTVLVSSSATGPTVFVRENGQLGRYFSTPDGFALYATDQDSVANQSICVGDCVLAWIPFTATEPLSLPEGVSGELALFQREDGISQVSYNGIPLYTSNVDLAPGQTNGVGVANGWGLVSPGDQITDLVTPVAPTSVDLGTPRAAGSVTVALRGTYIQSAAVTFTTGIEYTFNVTNRGSSDHSFVIQNAGALADDVGAIEPSVTLTPGESASIIVTFSEPGDYQMASHVGADYQQGMALDITVN